MILFTNSRVLYLILFLVFASCQHNSIYVDQLTQAQSCIDTNPQKALELLDSILNPNKLNEEELMKYRVLHTQARSMNNLPIVADTAIFSTCDFFEHILDNKYTALANYYSGNVFFQRYNFEKAMESYLKANYYAHNLKDTSLIFKIYNNLGYIYHIEDMADSALANYSRALDLVDVSKQPLQNKLVLYNNMGSIYEHLDRTDSASFFFEKALLIAEQLNEPNRLARVWYNLGLVSYRKKEYEKALDLFNKALPKVTSTNDSLKIFLFKSNIYDETHQNDSVIYFSNIINNRLSEISDNYVLENIYQIYANRNKLKGNYKEALHFRELQEKARHKIIEENRTKEVMATEKKVSLSLQQKQFDTNSHKIYGYIVATLMILILILLVLRYEYKKYKREKSELESEIDRIRQLHDSYDEKEKLYKWSKSYLRKQPFGESVRQNLSEDDVLMLALFDNGYSDQVVASIMDLSLETAFENRLRLMKFLEQTK